MMVILLAVTNCVCGAIVFVAASLFTSESWIPVLLTIVVSTVTTIGFAWWISSDVLRPLDKLNLLAKSIERSPGMSVPKTTGAIETDDLLHTISRASRQLTNFIDLMDEVTAGNTKAAFDPLEHSDRLSESFQKLVAKVTDSIDAKAELNKLQQAVNQISNELSGLHRGEPIKIRNDFEGTKVISDALRFLIERQTSMTQVVGANATELKTLINNGKSKLSSVVDKDAARGRELKKLSSGISESNTETERAINQIAASLAAVGDALAELKGSGQSEEVAKSHSAIRKQFDAAIHKLRDVGEQSLAITHVAKAVQDLAKRSNVIALNTSIQSNGESVTGLATITQEIASLSERAEKANKAIAGISDSVVRDINEANASLQWVTTEVAKLSTRTAKAEESIERVREILTPLSDLPTKLEIESAERAVKYQRNVQVAEGCASRAEEISSELTACDTSLALLYEPLEAIRASVGSGRQILSPIGQTDESAANGNGSKPRKNGVPAPDLITLAGEK